MQGGGAHSKPGGLPAMERQGAELRRPSLLQWEEGSTGEEREYWRPGSNVFTVSDRLVRGGHTVLGIACIYTSQRGILYSQGLIRESNSPG